mmetsp:Transcript_42134/g.77032  ORF Transcript_42134/g.77032 Transcript_42134/m.77032 type:complete len:235 (+) Transcript_42134:378-1082(+)
MHHYLCSKINQRIDNLFHVLQVQLIPLLLVQFGHLRHARLDRILRLSIPILLGILPYIIGDLHGAELGSAHGTKVRAFGGIAVERLVVERTSGHGVQRKVELIVPTEIKSSIGESIVAILCSGEFLREVGGVGRNLVSDDSGLDVVAVGQTKMLLGGHVAEHGSTQCPNVRSANGTGDVIVSRSNVRHEGSEGVEGRLVTPIELVAHVLRDFVQGNVSRSFIHDLNILLPRTAG